MADFGSESVAAFRRNGWPTCVGISGRLGLEYAHCFNRATAYCRNAFGNLPTRFLATLASFLVQVCQCWLSQTRGSVQTWGESIRCEMN